MNSHYVYILKCSDNTFYTGYTNNLEKRINIHNSGKGAKYTCGRLPVKYVFTHKCKNKSDALKKEFFIKKLSRIDKLNLITGKLDLEYIFQIYIKKKDSK